VGLSVLEWRGRISEREVRWMGERRRKVREVEEVEEVENEEEVDDEDKRGDESLKRENRRERTKNE
jgi:hypothetical protein